MKTLPGRSNPAPNTVKEKSALSPVQVIERMFRLIDALARRDAPANLKNLTQETQLHPSTAYRILATLVRNRVVDRVEPGTYQLGPRLLELGALVNARHGIPQGRDAAGANPDSPE